MILWVDGGHGPRENMRRDAALLGAAAANDSAPPVLRLFTFRPAGITLGAHQDPARELDLDRARADGVEFAVRPTGGRAIYHDHEWTFSLAAPLRGGAAEAASAYAETAMLLAAALRRLGVPVTLSAGSPRGPGAPRRAGGPAAPCFASSARHELSLDGRKFAGIAQRRVRGALLQQGSLLLGDSHLRLADYLALDAPAREAARSALRESTAHAGGVLGPDAPLGRLADAIAAEAGPAEIRTGDEGLPLLA